jgi:hypothetical protein
LAWGAFQGQPDALQRPAAARNTPANTRAKRPHARPGKVNKTSFPENPNFGQNNMQ